MNEDTATDKAERPGGGQPSMDVSGEELFLGQLDLIERVIAAVSRRNGCYGSEAEDFASRVKLKLIEDDYAVLRRFRGKSRLATYLTTVVANLFRDERIRKWGRWRSSVRAKRLGETAVHLERLLYRDGHSLQEAAEILTVNHQVPMSRQELDELAAKLPPRMSRRLEGEDQLAGVAATDATDQELLDHEQSRGWRTAETVLTEAITELPEEDVVLLKMRFWSGFKVSRIALLTGIPQRQLYNRFETLQRRLRHALEDRGLSSPVVMELLNP